MLVLFKTIIQLAPLLLPLLCYLADSENPVLKFNFCPPNTKCEPTNFGANSAFEFGNIASGTFYYDYYPFAPSLSVSCIASEPLRWWVDGYTESTRVEPFESTAIILNSSSGLATYRYHILLVVAVSGRIRCESYENTSRFAEIYIAARGRGLEYLFYNEHFHQFVALPPDGSSELVIPCRFVHFGPDFNATGMTLTKAAKQQIYLSAPSYQCSQCFPRLSSAANSTTPCTRCGPLGLSRQLWEEAGRPRPPELGQNFASEFVSCITDLNCSAVVVKSNLLSYNNDCNGDGLLTCSDHYTALKSYPALCEVKSAESYANFRSIENCMAERSGIVVATHKDYDPRTGFRLKGTPDYDAVYMCQDGSKQFRLHMVPHAPQGRINAKLYYTGSKNSAEPHASGVYCTIAKKFVGNVNLEMIPCATLFDCELQQWAWEAEILLRDLPSRLIGEDVNFPFHRGKVVETPASHGVVRCHGYFSFPTGFVDQNAYFFTGLNRISYFTSDPFPPEAIILVFSEDVKFGQGNNASLDVTCKISTFLVFPTFQFTMEFENGSRSTEGVQEQDLGFTSNDFTAEQRFKVRDTGNLIRISCRAPLRNSSNWVTATLDAVQLAGGNKRKTSLPSYNTAEAIETLVPLSYVIIGFSTLAAIIILAAACVIFVWQKVARANEKPKSGQANETYELVSTDNGDQRISNEGTGHEGSLAFPPAYSIQPDDLQIDKEKIYGQGYYGLCVAGTYKGKGVAVKMIRDDLTDEKALQEFFQEVKLMSSIGRHENIVAFIGAVIPDTPERKCKAVVELSPYGDLLKFLRKGATYSGNSYVNFESASSPCQPERHQLLYFCQQIASGMEFLESKHIIHGDLAARNVLVFPNFLVKITDFGLSRKLYNYASNYTKAGNASLPWRWMAPESLKYMEFSPSSDMWAFGVTVWEIFTLGQAPFSHLTYSLEFQQQLEAGLRLEQPQLASDCIYSFMLSAWSHVTSARPSFKFAKNFFLSVKEDALLKLAIRELIHKQRYGESDAIPKRKQSTRANSL